MHLIQDTPLQGMSHSLSDPLSSGDFFIRVCCCWTGLLQHERADQECGRQAPWGPHTQTAPTPGAGARSTGVRPRAFPCKIRDRCMQPGQASSGSTQQYIKYVTHCQGVRTAFSACVEGVWRSTGPRRGEAKVAGLPCGPKSPSRRSQRPPGLPRCVGTQCWTLFCGNAVGLGGQGRAGWRGRRVSCPGLQLCRPNA